MAKKINFKSKSLWKKIGLGVLAGVVLIGAVFGVTALFRKAEEETQKEISPSWAIGGLTEDGAYLETKESIYTKDAFECYGLKTTLDFDNNISYRLFFYNEDNSFLESTSKLTDAFDSSKTNMPGETKYCRIVITPNEDSKISWYEKSGYANQLTIKVNKDQEKSDGVEVVLKNYFEVDSSKIGYALTTSEFNSTGVLSFTAVSGNSVSSPIDVSGYRHYKLKVVDNGNNSLVNYYFGDANNNFVSFARFENGAYAEYFIDIPASATYFYINYNTGASAIANIITDWEFV